MRGQISFKNELCIDLELGHAASAGALSGGALQPLSWTITRGREWRMAGLVARPPRARIPSGAPPASREGKDCTLDQVDTRNTRSYTRRKCAHWLEMRLDAARLHMAAARGSGRPFGVAAARFQATTGQATATAATTATTSTRDRQHSAAWFRLVLFLPLPVWPTVVFRQRCAR